MQLPRYQNRSPESALYDLQVLKRLGFESMGNTQ